MAQIMPLGISDFKEIRRKGSFYVDKTRFISDLVSDHAKVILLLRPRRIGKTLNRTMLREFFDDQSDNRNLFDGLAVCDDLTAMAQLGAFPVIYVTFKDLKPLSWTSCQRKLVLLVGEMFKDHRQRLLVKASRPLRCSDRVSMSWPISADEAHTAEISKVSPTSKPLLNFGNGRNIHGQGAKPLFKFGKGHAECGAFVELVHGWIGK